MRRTGATDGVPYHASGDLVAVEPTRVTLAAAVREGDAMVTRERKLHARSAQPALRFGARIGWQTAVPLDQLVGGRRERQVIVSARPRRVGNDAIGWVIVPEDSWTAFEPSTSETQTSMLPERVD